jgi:hypothetical protein
VAKIGAAAAIVVAVVGLGGTFLSGDKSSDPKATASVTGPSPTPSPELAVTLNAIPKGRIAGAGDELTGTITGQGLNQMVWLYSERLEDRDGPVKVRDVFAKIGPCDVTGKTWICSNVAVGPKDNGQGTYRVWVTVVDDRQALQNVKDLRYRKGDIGQDPSDLAPRHIADAFDYQDVSRQ